MSTKIKDQQQLEAEMYENHERMVMEIALKYKVKYSLAENIVEDLQSEGILALLEAIRNYDPNRGKLSTYAHPHIYFSMLKYLKKNVFIKTPPKHPLTTTYYEYFLEYYGVKYRDWLETIPPKDSTVLKMIIGWYDGEYYSRTSISNRLDDMSLYKIRKIETKRRREFLNWIGIAY